MATERLPMRHIREILRLKWGLKRSHRETARSLGISPGAVASVLSRASAIGLTWEALEALTDDALEQRLYGPKVTGRRGAPAARPGLDPHGTAARRRHPGAAAPRISPAASRRLSLFRLLRALPRVARAAAGVDAPGPQGRREALCRLLRQEARARRRRRPGSCGPSSCSSPSSAPRTTPTPRRPRPSGAPTSSRATAGRWSISAASPALDRPRSAEDRRPRRVPLRAGAAADVRRVGRRTTARRSCRRDRRNLATRPKSKWPCRSRNAGSSRGCAMRPSSRWPR